MSKTPETVELPQLGSVGYTMEQRGRNDESVGSNRNTPQSYGEAAGRYPERSPGAIGHFDR